jgi:Flp pilus assembly protein TadD
MHAIFRLGALGTAMAMAACNAGRAPLQITTNGPSLQAARDALTEGEAGSSLAIARGILTSQPRNVPALTQAGDAESALGDRLAAQISYKKALALSPRDVHARLGLGKLQIRDDLRGAEASFRAVLADAPHDALALNDLGYVLDLQERHAEAQASYRAALAVDPDRISTRVNLALSMALSGAPEQAEQMLRDLSASATASRRVRLDFAMAQVMAGHDKDAVQTLGTDLSPDEAASAVSGMAQLRQGKTSF